jgi:hypothetical protein
MRKITQMFTTDDTREWKGNNADSFTDNHSSRPDVYGDNNADINSSAGKGYNQQPDSTPVAGGAAQFSVLPDRGTSLQSEIAAHRLQVEKLDVRIRDTKSIDISDEFPRHHARGLQRPGMRQES